MVGQNNTTATRGGVEEACLPQVDEKKIDPLMEWMKDALQERTPCATDLNQCRCDDQDSLLAFIKRQVVAGQPQIIRSVIMTVSHQEQVPQWMSIDPCDFVAWASHRMFSIRDTDIFIKLIGDGWIFELFPDSEEYELQWTYTYLGLTPTTHHLVNGEFVRTCDKDWYLGWHCLRFGYDPETGADPYYDGEMDEDDGYEDDDCVV